jgi:nucleoside-diphosphate-sugar epimerase
VTQLLWLSDWMPEQASQTHRISYNDVLMNTRMNESQEKPQRTIRNALVTGASGFLGSHLALRLANQGISVRGLVRGKSSGRAQTISDLNAAGVEIMTGDVAGDDSAKNAVRNVDTVFHAAAVLGPAHLPLETYRKINAGGTRCMIEAARNAPEVERFVHVSSTGALGPLNPREVACEGTPPRPDDKYEITKLEGEEIALEASRKGFPAVIARPAWVYGPGDTRTLKLFRMIARRRFMLVGKAQNKQHPVWIDDVVDGLIRCAAVEGIEGRVYHLAGLEILTIEALCRTVADVAGAGLIPFRPPLWLAAAPGIILEKLYSLWGGEPPIDHRKVNFFRANRAYSIRRAKEELDWSPQMSFRQGLEITFDWYRKHQIL